MIQTNQEIPAASFNKIGRVIAVMSGKGGVGKSSVSALLACHLNRMGQKVGILDADITGPSIPLMFGLHSKSEANELGIFPAKTRNGIEVISLNLLLENEDDPVIWRGPLIAQVVKQFWEEVLWGELDTLVIDLPPGTGDSPLTVLQSIPVDGVVIVTSPQDLASMVVRKAIHMVQKMEKPILGLVENFSSIVCPKCGTPTYPFGQGKGEEEARKSAIPFLGSLPIDPALAAHCDSGKIEDYQNTRIDAVFESLI